MNKKQKTEKCKLILNKKPFSNLSKGDDFEFLMSILSEHPSWDRKKGAGVKYITRKRTKYGNYCFVIVRLNDTFTDISYTQCLTKPRSKKKFINMACRSAIRPVIEKFRRENVQYGVTKCPISNDILTKENTHIDHYDVTFKVMFESWIGDKSEANLLAKMNDWKQDNCMEFYFTDLSIINEFIQFHNKFCKLRAVTKRTNLSTLKKGQ